MGFDRLELGAERNFGAATVPRPAATVILLRGGSERLEVLLVKRTPTARFMGGAWVFPGGSVLPAEGDGDGDTALRAAAVRELREETAIELPDGAELVPFAHWITPAQLRTRFDTWFFLAAAPAAAQAHVDAAEVVDSRWIAPADALRAGRADELMLVFPTIKQLQQLAAFASAEALLEYARNREVRAVEPHVIGSGEAARIVLPGEPGDGR